MADSRVSVLTEIARLYPELVDPLNGPASVRGDGESLSLMPATYTPTVREYERLVRLMRDDRSEPLVRLEDGSKVSVRSMWWHLNEYWHRAERVIRHDPVTAKRGKQRVQLRNQDGSAVTTPRLDYRRHKDADEIKALRGIKWVADHWGLATEPMLPGAVIEKIKDPLLMEAA